MSSNVLIVFCYVALWPCNRVQCHLNAHSQDQEQWNPHHIFAGVICGVQIHLHWVTSPSDMRTVLTVTYDIPCHAILFADVQCRKRNMNVNQEYSILLYRNVSKFISPYNQNWLKMIHIDCVNPTEPYCNYIVCQDIWGLPIFTNINYNNLPNVLNRAFLLLK